VILDTAGREQQSRKRYTGDGLIFAGERRGMPLHLENLAVASSPRFLEVRGKAG
jgi:hypothetical protein